MNNIYLLIPFFFAACTSPGEKPGSPTQKLEPWESISNYQVDTLKENEEEVYEGGEETVFFSCNGKLLKVKEEVDLSWGNITSIFYCSGDSLLAFKEIQQTFPAAGDSVDHGKLLKNYEGLIFFRGDTVFESSHTGKQIFPSRNTEDYADEIKEEFSNHLLQFKQLKTK